MTELFRDASTPHALVDPFAAGEVDRIVAPRAGAEAADREARLQR